MSSDPSWLIVSNGHGEDHVGSSLALALHERRPGLRLAALPLVGRGAAYDASDVPCLGPRSELPSGGLTVHNVRSAVADLRAGLVRVTLAQLVALRRARPDHVVVVGDLYAHALAALVPAPRSVVQTLVSIRMQVPGKRIAWQRRFMERISRPERRLMRGRVRAVYARDELTAAWLRSHGVAQARWLGNPMMDAVAHGRPIEAVDGRPVVALLPGSRGYAATSVRLMLAALARSGPVLGLVAWTHGPPASEPGWQPCQRQVPGLLAAWRRDEMEPAAEVWWLEGRFADVLASAQVVVGTTGTAQEQAVGVGLPVVSFALPPDLSVAFLTNQQNLLGAALRLVDADPAAIATAVCEALTEGPHRLAAAREGPLRMGPPGASARIAADMLAEPAAGGG